MRYADDINEMVAICGCGRRMTPLDKDGKELPMAKGRIDSAWLCEFCSHDTPKRLVHWLKYEKEMDNARDVIQEIRGSLREAGDEHFVE